MKLTPILAAAALALGASGAQAACAFTTDTPVRTLTAGFAAWKAVTGAMAACGPVQAELDQEFAKKQPAAFAADPALYHLGGVANETMVPLLNAGTIRPLDELVTRYGQQLTDNQKITVDGKIMAVAMMVNAQHLVYREDILAELGIAPPATYAEVLAAAEKIAASGKVKYPLGATMKAGWNVAQDFVNLFLGAGGAFFRDGAQPNVNTPAGVTALETMKALTAHMDPEFLVSDSTYVQKQFQQGDIAMANLWASRVGSLENPAESTVAGKIGVAAAPAAVAGGPAATTIWWDGVVVAKSIPDAEAETAFRLAMEGLDREMVTANNDAAVWLIDGYTVNDLSQGVIASLGAKAPAYPASTQMGLIHSALGNAIPDFLTGKTDAAATLAAVEAAYLVAAREAGLVK